MGEKESILDNIETHKDFILVSVNPNFYPVSVIYSAAYAMLDKAHVIIDGDPKSEVLVELRPKKKEEITEKDLKELGYMFNDELINYSIYTIQATRTKRIREALIESALRGNIRGPMEPPGVRGDTSPQIPLRFPQPRFNQPYTNIKKPQPGPRDDMPDPLGIRKVKIPEDDDIPDPKGIMKNNIRKDECGCDS